MPPQRCDPATLLRPGNHPSWQREGKELPSTPLQLALNQVTHAEGTTTPSSAASFMHSRFWAAAVRNMALLFTEPCNCDCTR